MMRRKLTVASSTLIWLGLFVSFIEIPAWSHSGGTNANGCHGGSVAYHCHGGGSSGGRGYPRKRVKTPVYRDRDYYRNNPPAWKGK